MSGSGSSVCFYGGICDIIAFCFSLGLYRVKGLVGMVFYDLVEKLKTVQG